MTSKKLNFFLSLSLVNILQLSCVRFCEEQVSVFKDTVVQRLNTVLNFYSQ